MARIPPKGARNVSHVIKNNHRGGCHHGCRSCGDRHRQCKDFDPCGCRDCSNPPDCLEDIAGTFIRDPIFRGPCPPDPEPCDRDWGNNIFLFCSQSEELEVEEDNGRLEFETNCSYTSGAFLQCRGQIRLICGGIYLVFVTILVPANETLTTRLSLRLNGVEVPGTAIDIVKPTTGSSASFALNAVVIADEDDILSVHSSNAFDLTGNDVLATITLLKVN
jgi:hypothetical protein